MFAEIVDICSRPVVRRADIARLQSVAVKFVEHYERYYFKFQRDRVNICRSTIHCLLHLAECLKRFGPLQNVSQYWMERFTGWLVERLNARNLAAEAMLNTSIFGEAVKIFFSCMFHQDDEGYEIVESMGGIDMLGPSRRIRVSGQDQVSVRMKQMMVSYLTRKYEGMTVVRAKEVVNEFTHWKMYSRVRILCGSGVQTASTYWTLNGQRTRTPGTRPSHFVAAEMDADEDKADVYYGRILRLMEFDLRRTGGSEVAGEIWERGHKVVVIDWAKRLCKGRQGQVYSTGRDTNVFSGATMEDAIVIKRLIRVVEHCVPPVSAIAGNSSWNSSRRGARRSYFTDDNVRTDQLLSGTSKSADGMNRVLRGFERHR